MTIFLPGIVSKIQRRYRTKAGAMVRGTGYALVYDDLMSRVLTADEMEALADGKLQPMDDLNLFFGQVAAKAMRERAQPGSIMN